MANNKPLEIPRCIDLPLTPLDLVALPPLVYWRCLAFSAKARMLLLGALGGLVLGLVIQLLFSWCRNREGPVMVLDRASLEVPGPPARQLVDVEKVVVSKFQIRGSRPGLVNDAPERRPRLVRAEARRTDATTPGGPQARAQQLGVGRQSRYGTNLTVVPSSEHVCGRIARAAHGLGAIPVEGDSNRQP